MVEFHWSVVISEPRTPSVQESERPIKDSAQSMNNSDKRSLPQSSGSGGMRSMSGGQRSGSGGIRNIMENLSRNQDVSGQASPVHQPPQSLCHHDPLTASAAVPSPKHPERLAASSKHRSSSNSVCKIVESLLRLL